MVGDVAVLTLDGWLTMGESADGVRDKIRSLLQQGQRRDAAPRAIGNRDCFCNSPSPATDDIRRSVRQVDDVARSER